tara:strand:+ start:1786 stop:1938 length:153 start_codon:yes stop_codon:yes gene_type:complete
MPLLEKTVTGNSVTSKGITSFTNDKISLPKFLKITEGPVKSSKRSQKLQA